MSASPGTILIHPTHGPMSVVSVSKRKLPNGVTHECLDLETLDTHVLSVTVPVDRCSDVGLRDVITGDDLVELLKTLGEETGEEPENWSRRFKANEEKMRSGSVLLLAEVVRDILRRNVTKPVSLGERRVLDRGMSQLSRELFYSKSMANIGDAEQLIRESVFAT